jgi:hypothetical protein
MCPIQYQTFLVLLNPPDGALQSKVEKQHIHCYVKDYFDIENPADVSANLHYQVYVSKYFDA